MMLGKRKQTTAPWKKRYTEKVAKEKRSQFGPGYNPKVVSARPPPPNAESNGMIKLGYQPSTMHHHQSLYMQP